MFYSLLRNKAKDSALVGSSGNEFLMLGATTVKARDEKTNNNNDGVLLLRRLHQNDGE